MVPVFIKEAAKLVEVRLREKIAANVAAATAALEKAAVQYRGVPNSIKFN